MLNAHWACNSSDSKMELKTLVSKYFEYFQCLLFVQHPFLRSCKGVVCLTVELFHTGKAAASKAAEHLSWTSCHHFPEAWNSVRGRGRDRYRTRRQPRPQITKPSTQKRPDFHFHVGKSGQPSFPSAVWSRRCEIRLSLTASRSHVSSSASPIKRATQVTNEVPPNGWWQPVIWWN